MRIVLAIMRFVGTVLGVALDGAVCVRHWFQNRRG
jgi:hypothetical protein